MHELVLAMALESYAPRNWTHTSWRMVAALVQLRALPRNSAITHDPKFLAEYEEWVAAGKPALTQQEKWQKPWHFELEDLTWKAIRGLQASVEKEQAVVRALKKERNELLQKIHEAEEMKWAAYSLRSLSKGTRLSRDYGYGAPTPRAS